MGIPTGLSAPAGVRPPDKSPEDHYHFLRRVSDGRWALNSLFKWTRLGWRRFPDGLTLTPIEAAEKGYSYVGPKNGIAAKAEVVELRPPFEHAGKPHHWVQFTVGTITRPPTVWTWGIHHSGKQAWLLPGMSDTLFPEQAHGWRYIEPAELIGGGGAWERESRLRMASDEILQAAAHCIAELESALAIPADWKPTDEDVANLAIALMAGYHIISFESATRTYNNATLGKDPWLRAAQHAFEHAGYLPSIVAARRAAVKRMVELEKHIADLRHEQRAEDSARNWSA